MDFTIIWRKHKSALNKPQHFHATFYSHFLRAPFFLLYHQPPAFPLLSDAPQTPQPHTGTPALPPLQALSGFVCRDALFYQFGFQVVVNVEHGIADWGSGCEHDAPAVVYFIKVLAFQVHVHCLFGACAGYT